MLIKIAEGAESRDSAYQKPASDRTGKQTEWTSSSSTPTNFAPLLGPRIRYHSKSSVAT